MDSDINSPIDQCVFKFLCKNTFAAYHRQWIRFDVARGLYDFDSNVDGVISLKQTRLSLFSLEKSEFRAARSNDQSSVHSSNPKISRKAWTVSESLSS